MTISVIVLGLFWLAMSLLHVASIAIVTFRVRRSKQTVAPRSVPARVSLVRPVRGLENYGGEALRSGFLLDDAAYELIFCAHIAADPAVRLVEELIADYPDIPAILLVGQSNISGNPKLNNLAKSWPEIGGEWIIFCDSNVVLAPDYIQRLLAASGRSIGAVSTIHVGARPESFWAEIECAFLNPYHARWYMMAAWIGSAFVHGKTFLIRRHDLDTIGGMEALAAEAAEDVAVTKLVRARDLRISTTYSPVVQPLGKRTAPEVLQRQARWARFRRQGFPLAFLPELLSTGLLPILAAGGLAYMLGGPVLYAIAGQALFWYGAELLFLILTGWHISWRALPAAILRDLLIPIFWIYAWIGAEVRWGDHKVDNTRVS